jgi:hypothetical protein
MGTHADPARGLHHASAQGRREYAKDGAMQVGEKNGPCGSLAVDVGNTTTSLGLFAPDAARDAEPVGTFEVTTPERLTADEARLLVERALEVLGRDATRASARPRGVWVLYSRAWCPRSRSRGREALPPRAAHGRLWWGRA